MNALLIAYVAGGLGSLQRQLQSRRAKGGSVHALAGTWFFGSMLVLGVTASMLAQFKAPPEPGIAGILVCYFVATIVGDCAPPRRSRGWPADARRAMPGMRCGG